MAAKSLAALATMIGEPAAAPAGAGWRAVAELLTQTRISTLAKAERKTWPNSWASGMPSRTRGRDRATQARKFFRPMPGSITTGTAPSLNRAKTAAMSGRPCFTITSTRSPWCTPRPRSRATQASTSVSSSRKESVR